MTASVAFFNVNVVVFSVVIQYVVLGVYNLIRLSVKGTSIDYYLLQTELIFLSAVYVLALAFFFTEPPPAAPEQPYRALPTTNSDDDSDDDSGDSDDDRRMKRRPRSRGGLFRGDSKDSGDDRQAQPRQQAVVGPRVQQCTHVNEKESTTVRMHIIGKRARQFLAVARLELWKYPISSEQMKLLQSHSQIKCL